ncbi:MAG TPA: LytTR family DNA-binding domain-containing protein [Opitutus sp.]|nr:LytTR family DNA-binding domain-containing protein [Opitutus sp.]
MTRLRILIADDEPLARERVRALLAKEPAAEIIGEAGSGPEAGEAIRRDRPDVVFLDIQMPGSDGLQVVGELPPDDRPAIIFVTAHDRFAVDAFGVHATDYLLKPFDKERLLLALKRAADEIAARRAGELGAKLESLLAETPAARKPGRLSFRSDGRIVFLKPEEIIRAEAADNYVVLHLADNSRLMLRETLSSIEAQLGTVDFARVNRSAIVRLDQVKELQPTFHGDYTVVLRNGTRLPLSRSQRSQLEKFGIERPE